MPIPDTTSALYLACFGVGLLLVVLTTILGFGQDGDLIDGDDAGDMDSPSPFNTQTLLAFLTFFGGVGYALSINGQTGLTVLVGAGIGGLAGGALIFYTLVRFLFRRQTPYMRESDYVLPGTIARVTSSILPGGAGEIVFNKGGHQRVEGARSSDGEAIERGREVVIVRYEKGIAFVEPSSVFFGDPRLARGEG